MIEATIAQRCLLIGRLDASMRALRRLLAISLLVVLSLSFVSPLLALSTKTGSDLPACCRRNGRHHCMSGAAAGLTQYAAPTLNGSAEKCPYCPRATAVVHEAFSVPTAQAVYAGLIAHPAVAAQTESKLRISLGRARQKRGPPAFSFL
jgi:hypothetical protein